jgi:hypothetical protein
VEKVEAELKKRKFLLFIVEYVAMKLPFLTCEVKCGTAALDIADSCD